MKLDQDHCYQALLARDSRFDGSFYVGVQTTGIYCRTVCTARTPKRENCNFYPSAAAAEGAGFRPCLRCRPELAPGNARVDSTARLAATAAGRIEDGALTESGVDSLAEELGVTARHLRRVVEQEFGVTPIELAQTQRLLLAKRLLTDTGLSVTDIAYASGFASLRRFNALFKERYRLSPTDLRKSRSATSMPGTLVCDLAYRSPMDWDGMLAFLAGRTIAGIELVRDGRYLRTARVGEHRGWIGVSAMPERKVLRVEVSASLAPVLPATLARVKRLFDVAADSEQIADRLSALNIRPGLRVPGAFDGFEMAVRAILGQQISVKAARTVAGRYAAAFGEPAETPFPELTHYTPTAERVAGTTQDEIASLGIVGARARSILALAGALASGELTLDPRADVEATITKLKELPGIGDWTAQYIAMRALAWPDAFPHTDLGVYRALGTSKPKQVLELAEAWRPWRAYAVMHLWTSGGETL
jgi:AraC family transcriptional regulator of adaptative response / DNA-3-methyladenine glycosylase II